MFSCKAHPNSWRDAKKRGTLFGVDISFRAGREAKMFAFALAADPIYRVIISL
jgi:hypothetical protein